MNLKKLTKFFLNHLLLYSTLEKKSFQHKSKKLFTPRSGSNHVTLSLLVCAGHDVGGDRHTVDSFLVDQNVNLPVLEWNRLMAR